MEIKVFNRDARAQAAKDEDDWELNVSRWNTVPDIEGRYVYRWRVSIHLGGPDWLHSTGDDLCTGVGFDPGPLEMLGALVSFLSAAGESWQASGVDGENSSLFSPRIAGWAAEHQEDLSMLSLEIEERRAPKKRGRHEWLSG